MGTSLLAGSIYAYSRSYGKIVQFIEEAFINYLKFSSTYRNIDSNTTKTIKSSSSFLELFTHKSALTFSASPLVYVLEAFEALR